MINKYIILVNTIAHMGGAQIYINNKLAYMQARGWTTYVFYGISGEIIIPELAAHEHRYIASLATAPLAFGPKTINGVLNNIKHDVGDFDRLVIESTNVNVALWGELLANRLGGKNMVHLLDERNDVLVPDQYLDFYRFKYSRRELSGISPNSLDMLFRGTVNIDDKHAYALSSPCTNTVLYDSGEPVACSFFAKKEIVLGCIGRLEKPYVMVAAHAFLNVIKNHPELHFRVIFIGGAPEPHYAQDICKLYAELSNVELTLTGYLYPIPTSLLNDVDVFMSSAGSANVSYRANRITISIDCVDLKAIGILGYTTRRVLSRDNEPSIEPEALLEKVLFGNYLDDYQYTEPEKFDIDVHLQKHLEFLEASEKKQCYFPVNSLRAAGKDRIKKLIVRILGANGYNKIRPLLSRYTRRM